MSHENSTLWSPAFDELGREFDRIAQAEAPVPSRRRRRAAIALVGIALIATPAAIALNTDGDEAVPVPAPGTPEAIEQDPDGRQPTLPGPTQPERK